MPIPDFQTLMFPTLKLASTGKDHAVSDLRQALAEQFGLSEAERAELLPSGRQPTFHNRAGWAVTYLRKGNLLESTGRGRVRITPRGRQALKDCKDRIDLQYLAQFDEIQRFRGASQPGEKQTAAAEESLTQLTPEELLTTSYDTLRRATADELLERIVGASARFFEEKVVQLLVKMGYGGSIADAAEVVGGPGDEGIDGLIKEDKLGLDAIYVQAKKWARDKRVGRPELQKFAGSLLGKRARKGVFITTAGFAREAHEYVRGLDQKIVLIDGPRLAVLMLDHGLGVSIKQTYHLHKLDEDFFEDE
ncbi:MAG TPA: restriction endonuclease [Pseudomonadota bacterium]|nr:restriction endonuclease [Pseudomonadota bacterium]